MLQTIAPGSKSAKLSPLNHPPIKQAYSGVREYLFPHEVEEFRIFSLTQNLSKTGIFCCSKYRSKCDRQVYCSMCCIGLSSFGSS